jgi:hypothetical protein
MTTEKKEIGNVGGYSGAGRCLLFMPTVTVDEARMESVVFHKSI